MRTIFKTKLDVCDYQTVELPQDFDILPQLKQWVFPLQIHNINLPAHCFLHLGVENQVNYGLEESYRAL